MPVLVAVGTVVVLLAALWYLLVARLLTTTERPVSVRERGGLGWFAVAPGTPTGAVAARSLLYWLRDARYLVNILVVPVAAALATVPLLIAGVPLPIVALVPVPIMALFFGWLPHNDVAYDSTAVWMHIASGIRGAADRFGRLVPILLIGIPLLAVSIPFAITRLRPLGAPARDGRRVRGAVPLRSRAVEHLVGRRAVSGLAAGRQPVPAAAALRCRGRHVPGARAARVRSPLSAPALWWAWLAPDARHLLRRTGAVGGARHRGRGARRAGSRSARCCSASGARA